MTDTNIASRALIVNLNVSQWSGRKLDRTVTKEVTDAHAASEDAGRFNKLLVDKAALAPVQTIAGAARLYVYAQTLPWGDNGDRVLMSSNYFAFSARMREFETQFAAAVDELVGKFSEFVDRARFRLNSMFIESDYPDVSEIRDKFRMRYSVRPVPTAADFRVDMSDDVVEEIKAQIAADNTKIMNEAMDSVWGEIKTTMTHLHGKLADPKAVFKASTIEGISDLIDRIPHLNLTDDPDLNKFRDELRANLADLDPKELRKDELVRKYAAEDTKRIMDQFGGMWGA
jgi:hypothetical protein